MNGHEPYTELVVGYALDALEPGDEQELLTHLPSCNVCQDFLADMREVAAGLASDVPSEEPPAALLENIRAASLKTPQDISAQDRAVLHELNVLTEHRADSAVAGAGRSGSSGSLARGRREIFGPGRRVMAVAAALIAVVALAGIGGYALHDASERDHASVTLRADQAVLAHLDNPGAYSVTLASGGLASAAAVVDGQEVYLVAHDIAKNDKTSSIYVLWAAQPNGGMVAVGTFDVSKDGLNVIHMTLPDGMADPDRFGVTHESGRKAPAVPGATILSGTQA